MTERIIGLDVETANGSRASICAIGLALPDGSERHLLVRPAEGNFAPVNVAIHGIREGDVAGAPSFAEVIEGLRETLSGALITCHNASFDVAALLAAARVVDVQLPPMRAICTLRIARATWPDLPSHALSELAGHLGLALVHHHAGSDARASKRVLEHAMAVHGVTTVDDLLVRTGQIAVSVEGHRADVHVSPTGSSVTSLSGLRVAFTGALSLRSAAPARADDVAEVRRGDLRRARRRGRCGAAPGPDAHHSDRHRRVVDARADRGSDRRAPCDGAARAARVRRVRGAQREPSAGHGELIGLTYR